MHDEQIRIIRGTIVWGVLLCLGAVLLSALSIPVALWSVALGVAFAVIAVKFYGALALLIFNKEGASFQFGVWFLLKIATLVILVVVVTKSSTTEICSFVAGSLVFIPAAFRYALIEAAKAPEREESSAPDESIER